MGSLLSKVSDAAGNIFATKSETKKEEKSSTPEENKINEPSNDKTEENSTNNPINEEVKENGTLPRTNNDSEENTNGHSTTSIELSNKDTLNARENVKAPTGDVTFQENTPLQTSQPQENASVPKNISSQENPMEQNVHADVDKEIFVLSERELNGNTGLPSINLSKHTRVLKDTWKFQDLYPKKEDDQNSEYQRGSSSYVRTSYRPRGSSTGTAGLKRTTNHMKFSRPTHDSYYSYNQSHHNKYNRGFPRGGRYSSLSTKTLLKKVQFNETLKSKSETYMPQPNVSATSETQDNTLLLNERDIFDDLKRFQSQTPLVESRETIKRPYYNINEQTQAN
ncbi:uncharacterized protein LOC128997309 [Macrosteles quadrilineatus]|uniref:uncharacterized protein LOC128997309 n=1 Tax=Macrosteles quadrilineatus TaxID=74068 RepID=UPI0023E306C1|nr:uncharacterized protein LOC128997309 [Macrosteles quadrilineatus]